MSDPVLPGEGPEPMSDEELAAIETRLAAATPGPWIYESQADIHGYDGGEVHYEVHYVTPQFAARDDDPPMTSFYERADADLVAASPTDLRRLLDEVQRLRGELAAEETDCRNLEEGYINAMDDAGNHLIELERARSECAAQAAKIEAVRTAFEVENRPVYDFPLGFEVMGETNTDFHHVDCSQRAGMLCDCAALAASGVTWVTAWRRAAETVERVLHASSGMPHALPQEGREYRCPECDRWAPWTDGTLAADNDGIALFWCQTCSAEAPLEGLDSRPQAAAHGPGTLDAPLGGTGVSGPENPVRVADRAGVYRDAAQSLQAIADHMPDTPSADTLRPGIRYAATLLDHIADDLDGEADR